MSRLAQRVCLGLSTLILTTAASTASADDWLQFRRDERRTAASRDRLKLPLTDIWTMPGVGTVTWRGRAFCIGPSGDRAALYCLDLRTVVTLWKRSLSQRWSPMDNAPPAVAPLGRGTFAVTADGVVYLQDDTPGPTVPLRVNSPGAITPFNGSPLYPAIAFRALDGAPLGFASYSLNDPYFPQAVLYDGVGAPLNGPAGGDMISLGPLLIQANEVTASSIDHFLFNWAPGRTPRLLGVAHAESSLGLKSRLTKLDLGGFPPASAGSGLVIGGMSYPRPPVGGLATPGTQHLAVMNGGNCLWHRDYPWSLGIPAVDQGVILAGAGGAAADRVIMAHEVGSGAVRWVFPPDELRPDGAGQLAGVGFKPSIGGGGTLEARSPLAAERHGHLTNPGVAVTGGRTYGIASGSVVALETNQGVPVWSWPLPRGVIARSLVRSPSHVIVSLMQTVGKVSLGRLVALRATDGKLEWEQLLPASGDLSLSDGLLFLSDGGVHAFAPAERTYHMAVDSPHAEDYHPLPGQNYEPLPQNAAVEGESGEEKSSDREAAETGKRARAVADATVVRLHWGEPLEKLIKQVRGRQAAAPGLPLLVTLDWLDSTRTTLRRGQAEWTPQEIRAFTAFCERLARETSPQHLDLAPEVDVYLTRDLSRLSTVRNLLRAATAAVKKASPDTKVLVSLNREVLARRYGRGKYLPFGKLAFLNREGQAQLLAILDEVDEIGLTSLPQSAFNSPMEILGDYLLGLKAMLPQKPILLTRLAMQWDETEKTPEVTQASYLKHLIQTAYWLNAELVAYPDLQGEKRAAGEKEPDLALRVGMQDRLAAAYWRDTLQWKRVSRLTASAADFELNLH